MMPLTMAKAGETVTIKKITGKDEVRLHLAELGTRQDDGKSHYDRLNSAVRCLGPAPTLEWSLNKDK